MSEQPPKIENTERVYSEIFPYPKLIQTFDYFFPKEKDAPDLFTMQNLRKFSRYAPYLALGILALIFIVWLKDVYVLVTKENPGKYGVYIFFDSIFVVVTPLQYL